MSITEFAVHNVLRTYSRQDRLGKLQKQRGATQTTTGDQVNLSPVAQKINLLSQTASVIVDRAQPDAESEQRQSLVRGETERLMDQHRAEIDNRLVSPEQFAERLNRLYIG